MIPPPGSEPREQLLFDEQALAMAHEQHEESRFRWLCLSEDAEAMSLRRVLEHCWALSGSSRAVLRKGLEHERWGQHAGAMAHLLALGLFAREGFDVQCEPDLGSQSPDLLVTRDGTRLLVEVRAITGCGENPWERPATPPPPPPPPRARRKRFKGNNGTPSPAQLEQLAREHSRRLAVAKAAARKANAEDLAEVVLRVLERKAAAYKQLCSDLALPYVICIYQDTDSQITPLVLDWAFGRGGQELDAEGGVHSTHDPANGVFFGDAWHFGHVSAVLVFGRDGDLEGHVQLRGDLIVNPYAERPLPGTLRFPHLRSYLLRTNVQPPRMRWTPHVAPGFEVVPHP